MRWLYGTMSILFCFPLYEQIHGAVTTSPPADAGDMAYPCLHQRKRRVAARKGINQAGSSAHLPQDAQKC